MKVLIIHAGNIVNPLDYAEDELLKIPTLLNGDQYTRKLQFINNFTTRQSLTEYCQVSFSYITNRKSLLSLFRSALAVNRIIKHGRIDLVNIYWGGSSALFLSFFCKVPSVITLMGSDLYGQYNSRQTKTFFGYLLVLLTQISCFFANGIIVMNEEMKSMIWKINRKKVTVIPEGIDLNKFKPLPKTDSREILKWDMNIPKVLFFNNSHFVKNAKLANEVVELVKLKIKDVELVEVKDIKHELLVTYYNAADVLLITSFHEGSNNSVKEAISCNCPVVSVNVGDVKERLSGIRNSFIHNFCESEDMAESICKIIESRERSDGAVKIRELEVSKVAERIYNFYKTIV